VPSISTTVMSLASDTRLSATDERLGQRRELRFSRGIRAKKARILCRIVSESVFFSPGENAERFKLAVPSACARDRSFGQARNKSRSLCK